MSASAIVLAAGEGSRMKSALPKVAHEILGKPMIRWAIDALKDAGITRIVSVLGHGRDTVSPLVQTDTHIVIQAEQNGTADAVMVTKDACKDITGSLVVMYGDCPLMSAQTIKSLIDLRESHEAAISLLTVELENPTGYGRIVRDDTNNVARIVEQKDCTPDQALITECNAGFYCFDAQFLFEALEHVKSNNAQGEFYLTDVIQIAREQNRDVRALIAEDSNECLGVNNRVQLAQATKLMQKRINEAHMMAGVTMMDPETTWIEADVTIANDVTLLPSTYLMGTTSIETGSIIGPNTRLTDTTVGKSARIDETVAVKSQIDDEVTCGPRAYLREGTHLCEGAKAGTHVEIKKSTIGPHSKVPHLSYIGDTTMGARVNVGAGSITCNYDGEHKHPTTIGDDVFVGSDTMMVAPVSLGDKSVIAAGSVIVEDVPAKALGIARGRQVNKPGYRA